MASKKKPAAKKSKAPPFGKGKKKDKAGKPC
jgi:hypothetical protein